METERTQACHSSSADHSAEPSFLESFIGAERCRLADWLASSQLSLGKRTMVASDLQILASAHPPGLRACGPQDTSPRFG